MQALVNPAQRTPADNGAYVVQVAEQPFPVAPTLLWVDCPPQTVAYEWYLDDVSGLVQQTPA